MKKSSFFIAALPLAPSYCSKHRVTSQGWNYPVPRGEDTMDREFTADLSIQLPYHVPPEGFRMSSDSRLVEIVFTKTFDILSEIIMEYQI